MLGMGQEGCSTLRNGAETPVKVAVAVVVTVAVVEVEVMVERFQTLFFFKVFMKNNFYSMRTMFS